MTALLEIVHEDKACILGTNAQAVAGSANTVYGPMMALSVIIPDEVVAALRLPPRNVTEEIKKELAVHLFAEGLLPEASACRLAGLSRLAFERLLGERKIAARYSAADLDADVQTLAGA